MKKYIKVILMSVALCLTLGVMIVGIYSATSGSSTLSSFVKWNAIGVDAEINGRVSGNKSSDNITNSYRQVISADDTNSSGTWSIGSMNFDTYNNASLGKKSCTPIVMRFSIKNTSSNEETKLYYKFSTQPQSIVNVDYTYRIAYGTLGSGETWNGTDFFSSSYSGNMTVVDNQKSCSAVEKYSLSDYIDNGETAVFEISMVVNNLTTNISSASLTPVLTLKSSLPPTLDALTFTASSDGNSYSVKASNSASGEVIIPSTYEGKSVTSIADSGFQGNHEIEHVVIPNSVTSIGDFAFYGCSSLKSITIPDSITSIGDFAFRSCSGLTSITIPNSVTSIGGSAFSFCSGLTSITIPDSVTSIEGSTFHSCSGLTSIKVASGNTKYDSRDNCNAIIESSSNKLIAGCKTTIIPNTIRRIGQFAFLGCSGLTSITIPNGVTSIEMRAFESCSGLTSIKVASGNTKYDSRDNCNAIIESSSNKLIAGCKTTIIPNTIRRIGQFAFLGCSGLTSITIPNGVTSIEMRAFESCSGLTSIKVASGNTKYDSRDNCNAIIESSSNKLIAGCKTTIIPNTVTSIGNYAFMSCSELTSITIPDSVTSIGECAFYECSGLTSITIGNSVTSIGSKAFTSCNKLTKIFIPASVTTISASSYSSSPFNSCSSSLVIYCAAGSKPTGWGNYWNYYASGKPLTVNWGATLSDYNNA